MSIINMFIQKMNINVASDILKLVTLKNFQKWLGFVL